MNRTNGHTSRGFSLIEVLVSIGIIAALLAILIPVLAGAKDRSRKLGSAVNLRSIGQIIELYTQSAGGVYPAPTPGERYLNPIGIAATMPHWQFSTRWHEFFAQDYPWEEYKSVFLAPGAHRDTEIQAVTTPVYPSYTYAASFLGHPTIWSDQDIPDDQWPRLEQPVKRSMVRSTSDKALMWDSEMPYVRRVLEHDADHNLLERTPVLFADQHVAEHIPAAASEPVFNRAYSAGFLTQKLHNTRDGVYGRDF